MTTNTSGSSSTPASPSARLRAEGNVLYKQALEGGFCITIKRSKLARALQLYKEALNASLSDDEVASAYKNLGMLQWLFCKVELNEQLLQPRHGQDGQLHITNAKHLSVCKIYLFNVVESLSRAKEHGAKAKPQPWLYQLENVMNNIVEWASEQTSLLSVSHSPLLQYVSQAFDSTGIPIKVKLRAYKSYADALFKEALCMTLPDKSLDHKGSQSLLHDCCVPLRKAASCSVTEQAEKVLLHEIQELQESVNVHLAICEAMQAIALGDICISEALLDEEEMDMEKVKDALDCYRHASAATRELDMETEAMAISRIGRMYANVLKLPKEAHKYHFQALRLALTVMSPSIARTEWYQYCLDQVKAHQERVAAEEEEKHEKGRQPAMQRLKDETQALNREASKGAEAFLKHVYEAHPHPDLNRNVVPLLGSKDKVKASLKKALLHYHPDNNVKHGEDWKVFCEEICKHLNYIYAMYK
ncbi:hypothetical protein GOP47_0000305 [Adiantum capillus-veneris]|uniref:J domain-containing protein n=1 Tax=Adiantum capillus-veneris TaxID=13818 RepID=A0A9D4VCS4_ADICA|nr:hypothetical protein GOP47_0000305 [Adiantum capillus-veneris]